MNKSTNESKKPVSESGPRLFGPCLLYCLAFSLVCSLLPATSSTTVNTQGLSASIHKPLAVRGKYEQGPTYHSRLCTYWVRDACSDANFRDAKQRRWRDHPYRPPMHDKRREGRRADGGVHMEPVFTASERLLDRS